MARKKKITPSEEEIGVLGIGVLGQSSAPSNGRQRATGDLGGMPVNSLFDEGPPTLSATQRVLVQKPIQPFTSLSTNVKGLTKVDLSPCFAVVGENRAGKTAILDAARLAILGKHPIGPHGTDLMGLAPANASSVEAELCSPSGEARFIHVAGRKPPEHPEYTGDLRVLEDSATRLRALPATTMRNFLVGDKKAREAIFARFGAALVEHGVPIPKGLNEDQVRLWTTGLGEIGRAGTTDPAESLAELNSWMRRAKLAAGRQISALSDQLAEAEGRLSVAAAGAELLPELENQYQRASISENLGAIRAQLQSAESELAAREIEAQEYVAGNAAFEAEALRLKQVEQDIAQRAADIRMQHAACEHELEEIAPKLNRVKVIDDILADMAASDVRECPVCSTHEVDPSALRGRIEELIRARTEAATELSKRANELVRASQEVVGLLQRERNAFDAYRVRREQQRNSIKSRAAEAQNLIDRLQRALIAAGGDYTGPSSAELKARIEALRSADSLRSQVESLKESIRGKKTEQETAKRLEKEAEELLQALLVQAATGAEAAVNAYMPSGFIAQLDLSDGGCEWCVVGTDGRVHNKHAMAGSERASLLVALALAWTEGAPIRLLLLDDEDVGPYHSSPANFRALLTKIKDAVDRGLLTQCGIAGVRAEDVPAGWQMIQR